MRTLNNDQFFRAVIASLVVKGITVIDTRQDQHHMRFRNYLKHLEAPDIQASLPTLITTTFTGRYGEWEQALVQFQGIGITETVGPWFTYVNLTLSQDLAERILAQVPKNIAQALCEAAQEFV